MKTPYKNINLRMHWKLSETLKHSFIEAKPKGGMTEMEMAEKERTVMLS